MSLRSLVRGKASLLRLLCGGRRCLGAVQIGLGLVVGALGMRATPGEPPKFEFNAIPDATVTTAQGERVGFVRDVVRGRTAVICFFYTDCRFICVPQGRVFAKLAAALGPRLGRDVVLASLSLAPETDTVAALQDWSKHFEPPPGWFLLTGERTDLVPLWRALIGEIQPKSGHEAIVLLVDEATETYRRLYGMDDTGAFLAAIDEVAARRRALGRATSPPSR
jgi:protein SCO1/2